MNFILFLIYTINLKSIFGSYLNTIDQDDCVNFQKNIEFDSQLEILTFKNFKSFNEFKLNCVMVKFSQINYLPSNQIMLDSTLRLESIKYEYFSSVYLSFIKGIDLNYHFMSSFRKYLKFGFFYSSLQASIDQEISLDCNKVRNKNNKNVGYYRDVLFSFTVRYNQKTCPLIFQDIKIENLQFYGISKAFLKTNLLGFTETNRNQTYLINNLDIMGYRMQIDENLINKNMLKNTTSISFYGDIGEIDSNALTNLENLENVNNYLRN